MSTPSKEETKLSRAIQDALEAVPGCHFERVQSGVLKVRGGYMHCAGNGTADLVGVVRGGRFVGIEVKVGDGDTNESQDEWAACVRELGGRYFVVRSVREAVDAVQGMLRERPR